MSHEAIAAYLGECNAAFDIGATVPAMDGLTISEQARVTRFLAFANPQGRAAPEIHRSSVQRIGPTAESPGAIGAAGQAALGIYLARLAPIEQGEQ